MKIKPTWLYLVSLIWSPLCSAAFILNLLIWTINHLHKIKWQTEMHILCLLGGGVRLNVSHLPKWTFQIVSTLPSIFLIILRRHTLPWINHTPNGIAALQLIPDQSCRTPSGNSLNSTHGTGAGLNPPSTNGESRKVPSEKLTVRTYCPHTRLHPSLSKHQSCWSKNVLPSTCRQ